MLQFLRIQNLALVERTEVEFSPGFVGVTGETGAGKSILLGALKLLAGSRGDKGIIREGAAFCEIEATILLPDPNRVNRLLESLDLPPCEEGTLLLWRRLAAEGASRAQINGRTTTLANLQVLGEFWIDFHGPDAPQHLLKPAFQLRLLDAHGQLRGDLQAYREAYRQWRGRLRALEALRDGEQLSPEAAEFLRNEIAKLERLDLSDAAIRGLERDAQRLENARELIEAASEVADGLSGDEGIISRLGQLLHSANALGEFDPEAEALASRLESSIIELEDLAAEYSSRAEEAHFDEETAESIRERQENWLNARRKHGPEPGQVRHKLEQMRAKLAAQGDLGEREAALNAEVEAAEASAWQAARTLTRKRHQAAKALEKAIVPRLKPLGFGKARFQIEVEEFPSLGEAGNSACRLLFSSNPGAALQPLEKVASSGELARVMLAIKAVLAESDATPVMVFDEVDANVGGEIAFAVGKELHALARNHQVFCITHLPQVAARADQHFRVVKAQRTKSTHVTIDALDGSPERRLDELARMLGGRGSETARKHAEAMLSGKVS